MSLRLYRAQQQYYDATGVAPRTEAETMLQVFCLDEPEYRPRKAPPPTCIVRLREGIPLPEDEEMCACRRISSVAASSRLKFTVRECRQALPQKERLKERRANLSVLRAAFSHEAVSPVWHADELAVIAYSE